MKATQLDSILRDYEHTEEQEAIMSDTISKKKDVCTLEMQQLMYQYITTIS